MILREAQHFGNRALELRIDARNVILWSHFDFNIRFNAAILQLPARLRRPEGKLRLRGHTAVDQGVAWIDADDPAPVRLPISGPSFIILNTWLMISPSDPAASLMIATIGPITDSRRVGFGFAPA